MVENNVIKTYEYWRCSRVHDNNEYYVRPLTYIPQTQNTRKLCGGCVVGGIKVVACQADNTDSVQDLALHKLFHLT